MLHMYVSLLWFLVGDYAEEPTPPTLTFQPGVTRMCAVVIIATNDGVEPDVEDLFADLSVSITTSRVVLDPVQTRIDIMDTDSE